MKLCAISVLNMMKGTTKKGKASQVLEGLNMGSVSSVAVYDSVCIGEGTTLLTLDPAFPLLG